MSISAYIPSDLHWISDLRISEPSIVHVAQIYRPPRHLPLKALTKMPVERNRRAYLSKPVQPQPPPSTDTIPPRISGENTWQDDRLPASYSIIFPSLKVINHLDTAYQFPISALSTIHLLETYV